MAFLIFSDVHIHNYQQFNKNGQRLENTLSVVRDVFRVAVHENISDILFCGDLYDRQKAIPTEVINRTIGLFKELFTDNAGIRFISITGNHDLATKSSLDSHYVSALTHLDNLFDNFKLIDFNTTNVAGYTIHGIPYLPNRDLFDESLNSIKPSGKSILMIHQTPDGLYGDGEFSYDDERFKQFDLVLNGHIHHASMHNNILTVGSPIHRDFGDEGDEKGFWVYDGTDLQFISTKRMYPEFITGEPDNDFDYFKPKLKEWKRESVDYEFNLEVSREGLVNNFLKQENKTGELLKKIGLSCIPK